MGTGATLWCPQSLRFHGAMEAALLEWVNALGVPWCPANLEILSEIMGRVMASP